jgi:hypothetical protein
MALVGNLVLDRRKHILGGLKTYLYATDHTSSNIISRDIERKAFLHSNSPGIAIIATRFAMRFVPMASQNFPSYHFHL